MTKLITIMGAKDGVGTTTLAVRLATILNGLAINLSYPGDVAFETGTNCKKIDDVLSLLSRQMNSMLAGYLRGVIDVDSEKITPEFISSYLPQLSSLYDYIIFDAGATFSPSVIQTLKYGSHLSLITTPNNSVLKEAFRKLQKLNRSFYPSVSVIVNQYDENMGKNLIVERLGKEPIAWISSLEKIQYFKHIFTEIAPANLSSVNWNEFYPQESKKTESIAQAETPKENSESGKIRRVVLEKLLSAVDMNEVKDGANLRQKMQQIAVNVLSQMESIPLTLDKSQLINDVLDEALGLGPLETLLKSEGVSEVMVNARDQIFIEKKGKIELTSSKFTSDAQLLKVIERILAPLGRRIDESSPMVDARLSDGSRVNIIIPPLSLRGPTITVRKFSAKPLTVENLISYGALSEPMANFLKAVVKGRLNVLVSGGTGSGKTTLLNVLSSFIPHDERIITIEDAAELRLGQEHVVRLEARPSNIEGRGEVKIRDLVKNALRMRPDRIVIGECRGGEALDMLQAMNTGHDGSLTTIHANSPRDSIARLETLVMFSGAQLPQRAIREQIASAINIVVQLSRLQDGSRKIVKISEISGMEGESLTMQDIFEFDQLSGRFISSGFVSRFAEKLKAKGVSL